MISLGSSNNMRWIRMRGEDGSFPKYGWLTVLAAGALAGCTSLGATGPSAREIRHASDRTVEGAAVTVVDLDQAVGARLDAANRHAPFSEVFGDVPASGTIIG